MLSRHDRLLRRCEEISHELAELRVANTPRNKGQHELECRLCDEQDLAIRQLGEERSRSDRQHREPKL